MPDARDVVWLNFPGAALTKRRPVVVLSSAAYHASRPDMIVGILTSQTAKASAPTDWILQDWAAAGLRVSSAFRAYLATLPRTAVASQMGRLSDRDWEAVCRCVRTALAVHGQSPPAAVPGGRVP